MANKKQLAILKQGVAAWNKWREENPDAKINLRGAKLDGLDLSGANFRKADIRGANFYEAILAQADFSEALAGHVIIWKIVQVIFSLFIAIPIVFTILDFNAVSTIIAIYIIPIFFSLQGRAYYRNIDLKKLF